MCEEHSPGSFIRLFFILTLSLGFAQMMSSQSQYEATPFSQSSQATDSGPSQAKSRDSYGLAPFTVKQISDATHSGDDQSNLVVDGIDVTNVTLVGLVTSKNAKQTAVEFTIDDGTGRADCIRWVPEAFDLEEMEGIHEGMYVRVNGNLKPYQGKMKLAAFSVRPVTNFDEVSFHYIECIHFHMQNKNLKGEVITQSQPGNPFQRAPASASSNGSHAAPSSNYSDQLKEDGLEGTDQRVLGYFQQPEIKNSIVGAKLDEVSRKLNIPLAKIRESINVLVDEGSIYSSVDEDHYKAT